MMKAEIRSWHGAPALMVNGEPISPMMMKIRTHGHVRVAPADGAYGGQKLLLAPESEEAQHPLEAQRTGSDDSQ